VLTPCTVVQITDDLVVRLTVVIEQQLATHG